MQPRFPPQWKLPEHHPGNPTDRKHDFLPSSFDFKRDGVRIIPVSTQRPWGTVATQAQTHLPEVVINFTAHYLQLQERLHRELRPLGIPYIGLFSAQMQALRVLLKKFNRIGIVASLTDVPALRTILNEGSSTVSYCQIVLSPYERPLPDSEKFLYELHIVPGMPILYQCEHLAAEGSGEFHPCAGFTWSFNPHETGIADSGEPSHFSHTPLPQHFGTRAEPCACGTAERIFYL